MKRIQLTKGMVALVDDQDFAALSAHRWQAWRRAHVWYAVRDVQRAGVVRRILIHREIMQPPRGLSVDHKNHDGLDNRRANLRVCSQAGQVRNQRPIRGGSSRFKGVTRSPSAWIAQIKHGGRKLHLGSFREEEKAARAYDRAATKLFGAFACLNFA